MHNSMCASMLQPSPSTHIASLEIKRILLQQLTSKSPPYHPQKLEDDTAAYHEYQQICTQHTSASPPSHSLHVLWRVEGVHVQSQIRLIGGFCPLSFFLISLCGLPIFASCARAYARFAFRCCGVCACCPVRVSWCCKHSDGVLEVYHFVCCVKSHWVG